MASTFRPTHEVPAAGLDTWDVPDPARPHGPLLPGHLPVQRIESLGAWAHILCSNGWEAWVDDRRLVALGAAPVPRPPPSPSPAATVDTSPVVVRGMAVTLPLVGAAGAVVSCFLPWLSPNGQGITAFKLPVSFLVDQTKVKPEGLALGWVLVALAVVAVVLQLTPATAWARKVVGWAFVVVASVFVAQTQRLVGQLQAGTVLGTLGLGVYVALVSGLLIARGRGSG